MLKLRNFQFILSNSVRNFNAIHRKSVALPNFIKIQRNYSYEISKISEFDREKKLKILELEIDVLRQEGRKAPDPLTLKEQNWEHLLKLDTRSARRKYYQYLWSNEKKQESRLKKKEEKKEFLEQRKEEIKKQNEETEHLIYGLNNNTMFLRIYDTTINQFNNNKLIRAMLYGQKIIIDCSYDQHMTAREQQNAAKQLMLCFAENRFHDDPFDIHFCNVNMEALTMKHLRNYIPTMCNEDFPINVHQQSYLDLFPKEKLVYLTPHCQNDLHTYSHDDVYIIGAMVDKVNNEPLSLAKAKKQGLRMARLPLDKYFAWGAGSGKSLTLNQMINIMLEIKSTGDWMKALRFVPKRKIVNEFNDEDRNFRMVREKRNLEKFKFDIESWGSTPGKSKYNRKK